MAVEFSQTFTPTGFSTGDSEQGTLSLDLPDCARWDYGEPFPRSYLLCGDVAYSWNEGETSGRRFEISPQERAGLDLLRLDVSMLRESFDARLDAVDSAPAILLSATGETHTVLAATLTLSADGERLVSLEFEDLDGNQTLFEIDGGAERNVTASFDPPAGIEWLEH